MKRKNGLIFFTFLIVFYFSGIAAGKTVTISPGQKIQDGINQAAVGDIVEVLAGNGWVYSEALKIINKKNLKIIGTGFPKIKFVAFGEGTEAVVTIQGQQITFEGFKIEGEFSNNCNIETIGITIIQNSSDVFVKNNEISRIGHNYSDCKNGGDSYGIKIKDTDKNPLNIQRIHIEQNFLHDLQLGTSESIAVNGDVSEFWVEGNTIRDVDNIAIDVIGFEDGKPFQAKLGKVAGNKVFNLKDKNPGQAAAYPFIAGIYIDGGTRTLIERNFVHDFGIGISVGSEGYRKSVEYIDIVSNVVFDNKVSEILVGKFEEIAKDNKDTETQRGFVRHCKILNNTISGKNDGLEEDYAILSFASGKICDKSTDCKTDSELLPNLVDIVVANNIILAKGNKLAVGVTGDNEKFHSDEPVEFKDPNVKFLNNLFWEEKSFTWKWNKAYFQKLAGFETALKNKAALNFSAKPNFETQNNSANCSILKDLSNILVFNLSKTSPAINYGVSSDYPNPESSTDICGKPRIVGNKIDVGAFEFQE
jgi:hypothetical protein